MAFEPYVRRKEVEDLVFDFWIGDEAARQWYDVASVDGTWLEMRFIRDHLIRPGQVIFDCGAHHGCTAIAMAKWTGAAGRVVAFEPAPYNAAMIRRNVELNRMTNVDVEENLLGSGEGQSFINTKSNASVLPSGEAGIRVRMTSLDAYADLRPALLKIDVEGFEAEVLKGARRIMESRPALAIEVHPPPLAAYGSSVEELLDLIGTEHYDTWIQWDDNEEPVAFQRGQAITQRVHLFGVPR